MKRILLFLMILPFVVFSQCQDDCTKEKVKNSQGTYIGCLDDAGNFNGFGKAVYSNGNKYEGCWQYNEMHGNGKLTFATGQVFEGEFTENNFSNGKLIYNSKDYSEISVGKFMNFNIISGTSTVTYSNNVKVVIEYLNGVKISENYNNKNYYNKEDIICDNEYVELEIDRRDNHFWVDLKINNVVGSWIFDTGGSGLSIGSKLWKRLKESGVEYLDLEIDVETVGIASNSTIKNKYVLIDEIDINGLLVKNVVAIVRIDEKSSLMGAQFYDKFSNVEWSMKEAKIKFYK
jgi:predicted aspartyl protease